MTVIAAASWGGATAIACDSAGTRGFWSQRDYGSKLTRHRFGWAGFTGSYRVHQVIEYELRKLERLDESSAFEFSSLVAAGLKAVGWSGSSSTGVPTCEGLELIVATNEGELWGIFSDLAMLRVDDFAAAGCGEGIALGSLHRSRRPGCDRPLCSPSEAVELAVQAAKDLNAGCGGRTFSQSWRNGGGGGGRVG